MTKIYKSPAHADEDAKETLRIGVFVDCEAGTCAPIVLNTETSRYAFITLGEREISGDDGASVVKGIKACSADILRWVESAEI